jgi:hypothetical protein
LEVDGLHRNAGSFGDLLQPRGRVAVLDEQLGGRVDNATFRGTPDRPSGGRALPDSFDRIRHSMDSNSRVAL